MSRGSHFLTTSTYHTFRVEMTDGSVRLFKRVLIVFIVASYHTLCGLLFVRVSVGLLTVEHTVSSIWLIRSARPYGWMELLGCWWHIALICLFLGAVGWLHILLNAISILRCLNLRWLWVWVLDWSYSLGWWLSWWCCLFPHEHVLQDLIGSHYLISFDIVWRISICVVN